MRKRLERAVALARALPGKISLYALYPETGDEVRLHADRPMEAASVIKLPIMVRPSTRGRRERLTSPCR